MRRSGVLALLMLLALWLPGMPVSAGKGWCRSDPIVRINGTDLQIWVAIPIEDLPDVIGPIQIEIVVPRGSINELVYVDEGFNGFGEAFRWAQGESSFASDGSLTVRASVSVPIRNGRYVPMQVELIPSNGIASAVYGETVGVEIDVTLHGSRIAQTTVRGASVTGAPAIGGDGQTAIGGNAVGGSAIGADATGTWVSTRPSPTPPPASQASPEAITPAEPTEPGSIAPATELPDEANGATPAPSEGTEGAASPTPDATPVTADDLPLDAPDGSEASADAPPVQDAGATDAAGSDTQATPETPEATASDAANDLETPAAEPPDGGSPRDGDTAGQQSTEHAERMDTVEHSEEGENAATATPTPEPQVPEPSPDAGDDLESADAPATPAPASDESIRPDATAEETPATPEASSCTVQKRDESEENTPDPETPCVPETHDSHEWEDSTPGTGPATEHEPEAGEER